MIWGLLSGQIEQIIPDNYIYRAKIIEIWLNPCANLVAGPQVDFAGSRRVGWLVLELLGGRFYQRVSARRATLNEVRRYAVTPDAP